MVLIDADIKTLALWATRSANAVQARTATLAHMLCAFYLLQDRESIRRAFRTTVGLESGDIQWPNNLRVLAYRTKSQLEKGVDLDKRLPFDGTSNQVLDRIYREDPEFSIRTVLKHVLASGVPAVAEFWKANPSTPTEGRPTSLHPMIKRIGNAQEMRTKLKGALSEDVLGQEQAVEMLANSYFDACLVNSEKGPRGVFTFLGPQGTGKTLMAEAFARILQDLESNPIAYRRFDMGMFTQWEDAAVLFGSASNRGQIQEFVTANPRCVLLFDEIEKAHRNCFSSFLPMLDTGSYQDKASGKTVDFKEVWIIFTSNLGREVFDQDGGFWRGANVAAEAFDILASAKKREEINDEDAVPVLSPEFVSRLAKGGAIIFSRLQGRHFLELLDQGLQEHNRLVGKDLPAIHATVEAQMAFLLSLLPNLDARKASSRGRRWAKDLIRQAYENLGDELAGVGEDGFSINVSLGSKAEAFLEGKLSLIEQSVLLLDDDRRTFDLLQAALQGEGTQILRCTDKAQLEARLAHETPSFALVDLNLQKGPSSSEVDKAVEALESIHGSHPKLPVHVYSENPDFRAAFEGIAKRVLRKGLAQRYLPCYHRHQGAPLEDLFPASVQMLVRQARWERLLMNQERGSLQVQLQTTFSMDATTNEVHAEVDILKEETVVSATDFGSELSFCGIPNERFEDIIGLDRAKRRLTDVLAWIRDPRPLKALGGRLPRGYLLAGPPGCGKTSLARAFAGEAGLPFLALAGGDFQAKWYGESEERIREVFQRARTYAPSIIFIDELDGLAPDRGKLDEGTHFMAAIVNQLLACMDGFKRDEAPVFVLGATNHPDQIDPALRRPGRFDEVIPIDLPAYKDRLAFFKKQARTIPGSESVDLEHLARSTTGRSPAYLDQLIREAKYLAARERRAHVTPEDFEKARQCALYGSETGFELNSEELELTAHHEAGHAIARLKLFPDRRIDLITIAPRENGALGFVATLPSESKVSISAKDIERELIVLLAGREAERRLRGEAGITTGGSDDIRKATSLAANAVMRWGFSEEIGPIVLDGDFPQGSAMKPIQQLLKKAEEATRQLLDSYNADHHRIVDELLQKQSLEWKDLQRMFPVA